MASMVSIAKHLMTVADVARVLELGPDRVRALDSELAPIRLPNGHRRYSVEAVERYASKRRRAA